MTIRKKLMILLFSITLIPLLGIILLYQITLSYVSNKISDDITVTLEETGRHNMLRMLNEYETNFRVNARLLETLIQLQAREVERAMAKPVAAGKSPTDHHFGLNVKLADPADVYQNYQKTSSDGSLTPFEVSFRRQDFLIAGSGNQAGISNDLQQLSKMTAEYFRIYQLNPQMIFWQYTALENGLHTSYPSGAVFPENFDPRQRGWYTGAKKAGDIYWSAPYLDALTGKPMLTVSQPVYLPNGSLAGVTGIDILLTSLFQWISLNPRWTQNAIGMLIYPEGLDSLSSLKIFASLNYQDSTVTWDQDLAMTSLVSPDQKEFGLFLQDLKNGQTGIRVMPYQGRQSYWVYQGFGSRRVYPLFIIPYENVTKLAIETDTFLFKKNFEVIRYTVILVFIVIGIIIWMAIKQAKTFTQPIDSLAAAGNKLAGGDYTARAEIQTGDELQQLGEVFNQIGPKLQEHQKMQKSLELARAVQQRLLPRDIPKLRNFDLAGLCRYSDETGGDYYDFIDLEEIEPGRVSTALGDITGHGVGAALLMASARAMLRSNIRYYRDDLSRILFEFNNQLTNDTDPDKFITLFLGMLDDQARTLIWATGGHDPALWYRKKNDQIEELQSGGVPIGFVPDMNFEKAGPVELEKGDVVVIGTDGIWEAHNQNDEMFGKERLMELIKINKEEKAQDICQNIVHSVLEFCSERSPEDDITIVVIKRV